MTRPIGITVPEYAQEVLRGSGKHFIGVPLKDRLYASFSPEPNTGCWLWVASLDRDGYGAAKHQQKSVKAHRLVYEVFKGPIPEGKTLDHLCRVRCCVNPDHLEPVTGPENTKRGARASSTHCKRGHPLFGDNLMIAGRVRERVCRTCRRMAWAKHASEINRRRQERKRASLCLTTTGS